MTEHKHTSVCSSHRVHTESEADPKPAWASPCREDLTESTRQSRGMCWLEGRVYIMPSNESENVQILILFTASTKSRITVYVNLLNTDPQKSGYFYWFKWFLCKCFQPLRWKHILHILWQREVQIIILNSLQVFQQVHVSTWETVVFFNVAMMKPYFYYTNWQCEANLVIMMTNVSKNHIQPFLPSFLCFLSFCLDIFK